MEALLTRIRERLETRQYASESAVREAIVFPILQFLGWDIFDPHCVVREFSLGGRRVDYALSATPPRHDIFIEVKAVGQGLGADRQLFEYAFHEGIPFAVLTDGREWSFFLPGEQGSYEDRRVQKVDLSERTKAEAALYMSRYLSFSAVKSGEALRAAQSDYRTVSSRKTAARRIPEAWEALRAEPDDLLLDLISEKTEAISGYRPSPEDVEDFVLKHLNPVNQSKPLDRSAETQDARVAPAPKEATARTPISERHVIYEVFGKPREARTSIEALVEILHALAARQPDFFARLAEVAPSRSRNHIARSPEAVYPARPELSTYTIEIAAGWWLGTNIANREKMTLVRKACDVAGVRLGKDVKVELPNAS